MPRTTVRLAAHISPEFHTLLKRAAEIEGRTVTDFVIANLHAAAQQSTERAEIINLSLTDQQAFAQALLTPPDPTPALTRAFARRDKYLGIE